MREYTLMATGLLGTTLSGTAAEPWLQLGFATNQGSAQRSTCTVRRTPRTFTEQDLAI